MPDWAKEIRAAIAPLNLDPVREAEVVEELSQHLRDRYDEMLAGGTDAEQAYQSLLNELNDGTLVAGLCSGDDSGNGGPVWRDLVYGDPAQE
jgi:hypothetical protein